MSKSRLEYKVGLFVLIGLVLLAALMLEFSKGLTFFRHTYQIRLHAGDVGVLKPRSSVLMSGVQIGTVSDIQLAPDGRSVTIYLKIFSEYEISRNAEFAIEAQGFLGDQYVAIKPALVPAERLKNNDEVVCEEPLNIQAVARSFAGFINRVDEAARKIDDTIVEIRRLVLNERNLTNLSLTVTAMRTASERALSAMDQVNALVLTNSPLVSGTFSNLLVFSDSLTEFSGSLNELIATNKDSISDAVQNIEASTVTLKKILDDAHAGKGLAGTLLHDEAMSAKVGEIVNNLSITTSNLNRLGLWRVFFPRQPRPANAPSGQIQQSPKSRSK